MPTTTNEMPAQPPTGPVPEPPIDPKEDTHPAPGPPPLPPAAEDERHTVRPWALAAAVTAFAAVAAAVGFSVLGGAGTLAGTDDRAGAAGTATTVQPDDPAPDPTTPVEPAPGGAGAEQPALDDGTAPAVPEDTAPDGGRGGGRDAGIGRPGTRVRSR